MVIGREKCHLCSCCSCYNRYLLFIVVLSSIVFFGFVLCDTENSQMSEEYPVKFKTEELKERLSPQQFDITQNKGTERAFTGIYWDNHNRGTYRCIVCNQELFSSSTKFDSGSGWPSFYDIIKYGAVKEYVDTSHGMRRTEIVCAKRPKKESFFFLDMLRQTKDGRCGAHLGHLFNDGPRPTGKRYCINSGSLQFQDEKNEKGPVTMKEDL